MRRSRSAYSAAIAFGVIAAGCGGESGSPDASVPDAQQVAPGHVALSWSLVDDGEPISCDDVGAVSMAFTAIPLDGFAGEVRTRRCDEGEAGVTLEMAPGAYSGRVELISVAGPLGEAVPIDRIEVEGGGEVVVEPITFDVPRSGGANFRVQARPFADNCDSDGSPAIEELKIELHERGGDCVPVTFAIEVDGDDDVLYESDCEGAVVGCVEHTQRISFSDVEPGRYLLDIVARDEAGTCLDILNQFEVAGGGLATTLGTLVLGESDACAELDLDAGVLDAGVGDAGDSEG